MDVNDQSAFRKNVIGRDRHRFARWPKKRLSSRRGASLFTARRRAIDSILTPQNLPQEESGRYA